MGGNKVSIKELPRSIKIELKRGKIILLTSCKNTKIGIKNPKIPFNFASREGAGFIASILGDGELNNQLNVRYNNQSKKLIDIVLYYAKRIFGNVDYKIYLRKDNTFQLHFPKIIGLVMLGVGIKPGFKSRTNQHIPKFLFELDNKAKSVFLKQFYSDEGNIRLKDRRLQVKQTIEVKNKTKNELRKNINKHSPNVLRDIQKLLLDLNITSKISLGAYRIDKRIIKTDWELSSYGKENLENFQKNVGFYLDYKNELLDKSLKSYKFPSAPRNNRLDFALEKAKIVQKKYGFVRKDMLAKECKRSLKTATYYLIDLKKKGLINVIDKPRINNVMPLSWRYQLT